jgi:hypothetical protein
MTLFFMSAHIELVKLNPAGISKGREGYREAVPDLVTGIVMARQVSRGGQVAYLKVGLMILVFKNGFRLPLPEPFALPAPMPDPNQLEFENVGSAA